MNTPPPRKITEEEAEATIAANRFMHLLHHPEEQDRDGEQTAQARNHATNGLAGSSLHLPLKVLTDAEAAVTTKLQEPAGNKIQTKAREIAPWITAARQARHE